MPRFGSVAVFLTLIAPGALLRCQERVSVTPRARPAAAVVSARAVNLRYDVQLVQIPVVVTDARGKPVIDLARESFHLFEDDVERPISAFAIDDAPVSATVVFDSSRSMKNRIVETRAAVERFLDTALPGDDFSLVRFSDRAEVLSPFTPDPGEISRSLSSVAARGWTALFDALCLAAQQVRLGRNQRKVLIVFSDGGDNNSRYSESELVTLLRERDVAVFAVSLFEKPRSLDRIAEETGGRAFWVRRMEDLPEATETLSRQIRSQYLLGYNPGTIAADGKYHRIRIELRPPEGTPRLHASWRHGYLAPQ